MPEQRPAGEAREGAAMGARGRAPAVFKRRIDCASRSAGPEPAPGSRAGGRGTGGLREPGTHSPDG